MGCGAAEAIGLGFVCFVVFFNVFLADRVDFGLLFFFLLYISGHVVLLLKSLGIDLQVGGLCTATGISLY